MPIKLPRELRLPTPLQRIENALTCSKQVRLYIKRDDLIHPLIQGNKWRKLNYNFAQMQIQHQETLLTFGGPYSNHIAASLW